MHHAIGTQREHCLRLCHVCTFILLDYLEIFLIKNTEANFQTSSQIKQRSKNIFPKSVDIFCYLFLNNIFFINRCRCEDAEAFEVQDGGKSTGIFTKYLNTHILQSEKVTHVLEKVSEGKYLKLGCDNMTINPEYTVYP